MARALVSTIIDQLGSLIASEFKDRLGSLFASEFVLTSGNEEVVRPPTDSYVDVSNILEDSMLWEPFRLALQNAAQGSRILVTTRKNRVADIMVSAARINLGQLSDDDCWTIFSTIAFSGRDSNQCKELEDVEEGYWTHQFEFPRGIGRLSSLTKLSRFYVGGKDDSQRCELGELKNLNHLQGTLKIYGLGNVVDACEAKNAELKKKIGLRDLDLNFFGDNLENHGGRMETDVSILNTLEPPPGLENLAIHWYCGTTMFPNNWIMSLAKLKRLTLRGCLNLEHLPPLGMLQFLEYLGIAMMKKSVTKNSMSDDEEEG
nr:putative disease resistance protein [Quercus suber]